MPEDKARRNLRHALSNLRKVIGPDWIEADRGVALTTTLPWSVDVQALRSAPRKLQSRQNVTTSNVSLQQSATLNRALQLYRGEFLQGLHLRNAVGFEAWVVAQREECHLLALRGLEELAQHYMKEEAYTDGLGALSLSNYQVFPFSAELADLEAGHA